MGRILIYFILLVTGGVILYNFMFSQEPFDLRTINVACIKNTTNTKSIKAMDKNLSNKIVITRLNFSYSMDKVQVQQKIRFGQGYFEDEKGNNFLLYTTKQFNESYGKEITTHWLYRQEGDYSYFFSKTIAKELNAVDKGKFKRRFLRMTKDQLDDLILRACRD